MFLQEMLNFGLTEDDKDLELIRMYARPKITIPGDFETIQQGILEASEYYRMHLTGGR